MDKLTLLQKNIIKIQSALKPMENYNIHNASSLRNNEVDLSYSTTMPIAELGEKIQVRFFIDSLNS